MRKKRRKRKAVNVERDFTDITRPMTGAEIAEYFDIQRQAVSNTLKRALTKSYDGMKKMNNSSPFETMVHLSIGLGVSENELKKFYMLFPPKIRREIKNDAKNFQL